MSTSVLYNTWRDMLKSGDLADHTKEPQCGFYRVNSAKTKADHPVAIWTDSGRITIRVGNRQFKQGNDAYWDFAGATWPKCKAVEHGEYERVVKGDWRWSDGKAANSTMADADKASGRSVSKEPEKAPVPEEVHNRPSDLEPAGIGHNQGPTMGQEFAERLKAETKLLSKLTQEEIADQSTADKVAEIKERCQVIRKEADAERVKHRKPLNDKLEKIQSAFKPTIDGAKTVEAKAQKAVSAYLLKEQARLDEERRVAQQAADEEAARQAREEAELTGEPVKQAEVKEVKREVARAGGGVGKATTSNVRKSYAAEIVDYPKALAAFGETEAGRQAVTAHFQTYARSADARKQAPEFIKIVEQAS